MSDEEIMNALIEMRSKDPEYLNWCIKQIRKAVQIHAYWEWNGCDTKRSAAYCSNCGCQCPTGKFDYTDFNYCPWCGAKIDVKEGDKDETN